MKISVKANAKINLSLDILERLPNGYHSLYMIMQSVSLCDIVTVELTDVPEIVLTCDKEHIPVDERNTAYKAAKLFLDSLSGDLGVKIHIEKHIPDCAGLAGGSADAAAVLHCLNMLTDSHLSDAQLCSIGGHVGADVPFCVVGGTELAQDIGGVLSPLPPLTDCYIVLAKPAVSVSTKDAYTSFDGAWWIKHPKNLQMLNAVVRGNLREISLFCENVFEQVIDVPRRADIKYIMRENGALAACMSGSGPTVFGIFTEESSAKAAQSALEAIVPETYITCPTVSGVEVID